MMPPFFGHEEAAALFLEAMRSDRMHHAWILAGPEGVGKSRFAHAAALRMLAEAAGTMPAAEGFAVPEDHATARLFEAKSHPDFKLVKREAWKGDEIIPEHDRSGTEPIGRNIRVAQIRMLDRMLSLAPSLSPRRVILIDAADDLERASANALLKRLEEPPAGTVFLLVSHAPGRLLPTIRSRCRVLRFRPLEQDTMTSALRLALPEASEAELASLMAIGEGSPGRAVGYAGLDVAALDASIAELIGNGDPDNGRRSALAKALGTKAAAARYKLFLERAPARIAAEAKLRQGPQLAQAIELWGKARSIAAAATPLTLDPQTTVFELAGLLARLAPEPLAKAGRRR